MSENTKNMTIGKPLPILISFAIPLVCGNVFQLMYTFFDTVIVGKYIGVKALAALGAVEYINWLLWGTIQAFTQGFSIKMAQDFGTQNESSLKKVIGSSIGLSSILSLLFIAAGIPGVKPLLLILKTPEDILPLSIQYIHILIYGVPAIFAYNLLAGLLRSLGNSKAPLHAMLISSILNIVLDLIFVLKFNWGIRGAATATIISQISACLYCWFILRQIPIVRFSNNDLKINKSLYKKLFLLGFPLAVQSAIIAFGGMIVETVVNTFGGVFIASYVSVTKLYGFLDIAATSFGFALMTYVGQNYGAQKFDRIRTGTIAGMSLSLTCSIIIGIAMLIFGRNILSMFVSSGDSSSELFIASGYKYLSIMSMFLPVLYILWLTRSVIQGIGNTIIPMISGIAEFVMRTATALILPIFIGSNGILFAEVLAWAGADIVLIPAFISLMKKLKTE